MASDLPLSSPAITREDVASVSRALSTRTLVDGPAVSMLESRLTETTGQDLCVTTATYVQAVSMSLSAQGIGTGADVLIPAIGHIALAIGVAQVGARAVPVDCDPTTLIPHPDTIARAMTPETRALMAGGLDGSAPSLEAVAAACRAAEISFVEVIGPDLGTSVAGSARGSLGHAAVVDLSDRGHVGGGAGGAVVTSDGRLYDTATAIRAGWFEQPVAPGPCSMPEFIATLASAQLDRLGDAVTHCTGLAQQYTRLLSGLSSLMLPTTDGHGAPSWARYLVRLDETFSAQSRDEILGGLRRHEILASPGPIDVAGRLGQATCPIASSIAQRTLSLPIHHDMTDRDVDLVCQTLDLMIQRAVFRRTDD